MLGSALGQEEEVGTLFIRCHFNTFVMKYFHRPATDERCVGRAG